MNRRVVEISQELEEAQDEMWKCAEMPLPVLSRSTSVKLCQDEDFEVKACVHTLLTRGREKNSVANLASRLEARSSG